MSRRSSANNVGARRWGDVALLASAFAGIAAVQGAAGQPADEAAYLTSQGAHAVSVRDSHTLAPIALVPTDGQSIDSRLTPDGAKLYTLNVGSAKMSVIRARCPADRADWSDSERAAGRCTPNTQLPGVAIPGNGGFYFSIRRDGRVIYVTSSSPNPAAPPGANPFTSSLAFINVIDTRTDKILKRLSPPPAKLAIAGEISPDGKTLWIATADGYIQGLDPETGAPTTPAIFVGLVPATVKISPDGEWLYAANMPPGPGMPGAPGPQAEKPTTPPVATIGVANLKTFKLAKTIPMSPGSTITGIEVSGKTNQVWTANGNNTVAVTDMRSLEIVKTITTPFSVAEAVDVSTDGQRALVVDFNGKIMDSAGTPIATSPAFAQLYSTRTFEPIGPLVSLGDNSGGIPSLSSE